MRTINTDPVVEIAGLHKTYDTKTVVDDLSCTVERGEIYGILGVNGAGKTTTVECAQGLRRPDTGTIRVLGADPIREASQLRGRVGSQLQDAHLPERLQVAEAIRLFADDAASAARVRSEWDLDPIASQAFADLSGGQKQRLFLALALLNDPEVVFLDELTQGLDPNARREVWRLIERVRDRGTTVVLVTHFMEEAEVLCDRVAVMAHGRIIDEGTPEQLIGRHGGGVRMRFSAPSADIDWLHAITGVEAARFDRGEIELRGSHPMIAHVGAALVGANRVPDDLRVAQPTLEDALLEILEPIGA